MRYCHNCGYEISENEEFCPECGEIVAKRFSVCPKCGDENQIAVKHCRKCGFDLDVPEDVTYCPECDAPVLRTDSLSAHRVGRCCRTLHLQHTAARTSSPEVLLPLHLHRTTAVFDAIRSLSFSCAFSSDFLACTSFILAM